MSEPESSGFLSRWSRRKAEVRRGALPADAAPAPPAPADPPAAGPAAAAVTAVPVTATPVDAAVPATAPAEPPPTLDDVAQLTRESDYARFVAADVDPGVRNAAMKKLFSDPHFNVMDGLDVYIDDYGKPDPIPPAMLRQLTQARFLGLFDDEKKPEPASTPETAASAAPDAPSAKPDEDPDLRLQPDDAAGPERHEPDRPGPGADAAGQP